MCIYIRSINNIIFSIMKNTEYKGHINEHVMAHLNIKPKRKIQWDVVLFYLFTISFSIYIADNIIDDISKLFDNNHIKTEYQIELVDQDSINVYSISNDTVYKGTVEEFEEIVHMDNL